MLFLAIDGGGTGCRSVVADRSGRVLGRGQAGSANIVSDPDGARANILHAAEQALGGTGAGMDQVSAVLGLAGANVGPAVAQLSAALPFARVRVESDATITVKGALGDAEGIVAAVGTGSVYARQWGGTIHQIGGWGPVLGDEASGAWLGRALLSEVLRAVDGRRQMTPLLSTLLAEHGDPDGVVAWAATASPADLARLAPRAAVTDDPAAHELMAQGSAEVAQSIDLLQDGKALPVVFMGGLGTAYQVRLNGRWPIREPLGTALDGALHLALQEA